MSIAYLTKQIIHNKFDTIDLLGYLFVNIDKSWIMDDIEAFMENCVVSACNSCDF